MNNDLKPIIRDNVPVPERPRGRKRSEKWAFLYELQPGQVAAFEFDDEESLRKFRNQVGSLATRHGKDAGKKFTIRSLGTNGEYRVGVWRIE